MLFNNRQLQNGASIAELIVQDLATSTPSSPMHQNPSKNEQKSQIPKESEKTEKSTSQDYPGSGEPSSKENTSEGTNSQQNSRLETEKDSKITKIEEEERTHQTRLDEPESEDNESEYYQNLEIDASEHSIDSLFNHFLHSGNFMVIGKNQFFGLFRQFFGLEET